MKAVVRRGTSLILDNFDDPVPETGQMLVKSLSCGICGSDLHMLHHAGHMMEMSKKSGSPAMMDPDKDIVFGHEFCAEVIDYGPGTQRKFKPGTRVVTVPVIMDASGFETVGYSNRYPGGYGEYMNLMEATAIEVPGDLPTDYAAMTEPFAVGEHAVVMAGIEKDDVAMVIGCGPVGLAVIAALKIRGLGPVIASDFSSRRRTLAEAFGADVIVDPKEVSPHTKWSDHGVLTSLAERSFAQTMGQSLRRPVIFECVGVPGLLNDILLRSPPAAKVVVVGVCMEEDRIEPILAINKELDMQFVLGYSQDEFARTLFNIAEGKIDVSPAITGHVGLEGVAGAFADLSNPEAHAKIIVHPHKAA